MKNYNFLFLYLAVFTLSYKGLIGGGVGLAFIDVLLIDIFFIFTYISIFSLKIYNFKENKVSIPIILLTSSLYFYKVNFVVCIIYCLITVYLIFFKEIKGHYDPVNSVFSNFFKNASKYDLILIFSFIIVTFYLKFYQI